MQRCRSIRSFVIRFVTLQENLTCRSSPLPVYGRLTPCSIRSTLVVDSINHRESSSTPTSQSWVLVIEHSRQRQIVPVGTLPKRPVRVCTEILSLIRTETERVLATEQSLTETKITIECPAQRIEDGITTKRRVPVRQVETTVV